MLVAIAQLEKNRLFLTGAHTDEVMACIKYGEELLTGSNAIVLFYETIGRNEDNVSCYTQFESCISFVFVVIIR